MNRDNNLSPIQFGIFPENLLSPVSGVHKPVQFCEDHDNFPERLLLLNFITRSQGSEHLELGMPLDRLILDRDLGY
jgi:hypothetical protein